MKVAYFIAEFHRFTGSQKSLLLLIRNLPDEFEAVVIFPGYGKCVDLYKEHGINVEVIEAPNVLNTFGKALIYTSPWQKLGIFATHVFPYSKKVSAYLREKNFEIIHYNTPRGLLMSCGAPRMTGIPCVLHVRGLLEVIGRPLICLSLVVADRLFLVAEDLKKELSLPFIKESIRKKTVVIHDIYEEAPAEDPSKDETPSVPVDIGGKTVILIPSSLVPFKGYHHLLKAISLLPTDVAATSVFLGIGEEGDHEYKSFVETLRKQLGIETFHFLGWQKYPSQFYMHSDIVVLPSVERELLLVPNRPVKKVIGNEGLPRVLLEAMSFGKPVIGTHIAGVPELIIDRVNGFLVPPGDAGSLAHALTELIRDPAKRKKMGDKGKEFALQFTPENILPKILSSYRELLKERRA